MTAAQVRVAGRYRLGNPLGVGGMGRVWLAYDEVLHREVAVKQLVLPFGLADDEREELRLRTLREARAAARLSHPNIVRIYDVLHGELQPWIVMEYVPSRSLSQVLTEQGPLPVDQVARIGLAVLSALAAANRVGVLHRDVKPSNVLIADDGRVVLTDFGSAILDDTDGEITRTGLILGSPQYLAPERAQKGISTPESDLWSLGATLYTAAEGHSPFDRPTVASTLIAVATERPRPFARAGPLKPVLTGLLRKNPRARMTVSETERRLHRIAGPGPTTVRLAPAQRPAPSPAPTSPAPTSPAPTSPAPTSSDPTSPAPTSSDPTFPVPASSPADEPPTALVPAVPPARRPRWLRWAVAGVAAVVLVLGGVVVTAQRHHAPAASRAAPTRSSPRPAQPLPANLTRWSDPSGFTVPVPVGWKPVRDGPTAMSWYQPGGAGTLRVHAWDPLDPDPVVAMTREEARARLDNYHRVRIEALPGLRGAAWEYTFTGPTGDLHGQDRGFVARGRAYLIEWRVPAALWQANLAEYTAIVDGFQPPGPA
jgi:eukaryotic-like serine/threonine-protein kinase